MFKHPFAYVMVATFVAALLTMLLGVAGVARNATTADKTRSTRLMALRVGLCALLLAEIIFYLSVLKP